MFASHYLVPEGAVDAASSIRDLAETFLVDLDVARNRWEQVKGHAAGRAETDLFGTGRAFTCTACGRPSSFETGQKSFCTTCMRMADAYPDGDGPY